MQYNKPGSFILLPAELGANAVQVSMHEDHPSGALNIHANRMDFKDIHIQRLRQRNTACEDSGEPHSQKQIRLDRKRDRIQQGLIPLGEAFELDPPSGPTSFDWTANVANGTSLAFLMTDAKGRQGGSSSLLVSSGLR